MRFQSRPVKAAFLVPLLLVTAVVVYVGFEEVRHSRLQAAYFSSLGHELKFWTEPGASSSIRFPKSGPYDQRLGYAALPAYLDRVRTRNFAVGEQARLSPHMRELMERGLNAAYREKTQAGLTVLDRNAQPIFQARYPERVYGRFETVPKLLVDTLLFIENRELLDPRYPLRNPAVEWDRFAKAAAAQVVSVFDPQHGTLGGSTLATQIEKYRHSPGGRTNSVGEKLRQMISGSLRAYRNGADTTAMRHQLVVDYLNTVPLAARAGYGEVNGLGDGLWVWYGRAFSEVNQLLDSPGEGAPPEGRALAYKQALSLLVSQRRPSYYLGGNTGLLEALTNSYLRLLADAGVIPKKLRDAALPQPLKPLQNNVEPPPVSFVTRKAANAARVHLASLLGAPRLYDLDRLDLTVGSSLDSGLQQAVTTVLRELRDPAKAKVAGLMAPRLLEKGDPRGVIYSFTLFERTESGNLVRAQADNYDQPFDINEGTKLDLGSTAKLRTLVSYLEIVAALHQEYGSQDPAALGAIVAARADHITRWAVDYLASAQDRRLKAMLEAALERTYSASPHEAFFTGGGLHTFENFEPQDNYRIMTVREATRRSVNLVFIRLMRDIANYYQFHVRGSSAKLLEEADDPQRRRYLARFADREGRQFIGRFFRKYQGKTAKDAEALLLQRMRPTPKRLAAVFRTIDPEAGYEAFEKFIETYLPSADRRSLNRIYLEYSPQRFNLADRGYLAGVHPLELWVVRFVRQHPGATLSQAFEASISERQEVYDWLVRTRHKNAQDKRIRQLLELEAFLEIHKAWKRLGYPFDSLVPSYATAIGASADRPAALAELMGVILNDGVLLPTVRINSLHFAAATPYDTKLVRQQTEGKRVLPAEVAQVVRGALTEVIEQGTARRLKGVFTGPDGVPLPMGGKTGTGDHRYATFGKGGVLISSKVISRSGTFVFFIGERYFGTLTAYVHGPQAAQYKFTSGLPAQVLKVLAPTLTRFMRESHAEDDMDELLGGAAGSPVTEPRSNRSS